MRPIGEANPDWQERVANAAWRVRALEKPKPAADLHGESQHNTDSRSEQASGSASCHLRQSGTEEAVPFRYATRLTAPFTAQLLGQILPDTERRGSAAQAYSCETRRFRLGLDKRL
jgi:hypothetical protein